MPGIFINYRREDSRADAGRLFDWLSGHFGKDRVFMDIAGSIEPGMDFDEVIEKAVTSCEALIVVIGKQWLTTTNSAGRRRLDNPDDYVRLEIAKALQRNIRVIPVLVQEATMPSSEELPEDLARLAKLQALEISDSRWDYDTEQLVKVLDKAGIKPVIRRPKEESTAIEAKVPPVTKKLSVKAIISLVLCGFVIAIYSAEEGLDQSEQIGALTFSIVALALGISAFYDIKLNKVKGKVLAITGILLSTLMTLAFIGELSEPRQLPSTESASPPRIQPVPETAVPQPPVKRPQAHVDINGNWYHEDGSLYIIEQYGNNFLFRGIDINNQIILEARGIINQRKIKLFVDYQGGDREVVKATVSQDGQMIQGVFTDPSTGVSENIILSR